MFMYLTRRAALAALVLSIALPLRAAAPPSLSEVQAKIAALEGTLREHETRVRASRPSYRQAYDAIAALGVTAEQARAAKAGHLDALPGATARALANAAPLVQMHNAALERYYSAYDEQSSLKMDAKALEALGDLERTRADLAGQLPAGKLKGLDQAIAKTRADAEDYWKHRDVDEGRDSHKRLWALRRMSDSSREAELEVDKLERMLGLQPKPSLIERLRASMDRTRRFWLNLRTRTALLPPLAKIVGYLANPFRREDPDRISTLIRELGGRFTTRAKVELEVLGRENLPTDKKLIVTPSHRSDFVDTMGMVSLLTGSVTPIQTVLFYPKWARGTITNLMRDEPGLILAQAEGIDVVKRCVESIRQGRTLLFFPEGNIPSPLGELRRLRTGLESIADQLLDENLAIVPVTLDDPAESWGQESYATGTRELGMKVKVIFDRPLDPRTLHALSAGTERLLLNTLRESYHRNLLPTFASEQGKRESYAGTMDDRAGQFEALHGAR